MTSTYRRLIAASLAALVSCTACTDEDADGRAIEFTQEFEFTIVENSASIAYTRYELGISAERYQALAEQCSLLGAACPTIPAYRSGRWYLAIGEGSRDCLPALDLEAVERSGSKAGDIDAVRTRRTYALGVVCAQPSSPTVSVYSWSIGSSVSAHVIEDFSTETH